MTPLLSEIPKLVYVVVQMEVDQESGKLAERYGFAERGLLQHGDVRLPVELLFAQTTEEYTRLTVGRLHLREKLTGGPISSHFYTVTTIHKMHHPFIVLDRTLRHVERFACEASRNLNSKHHQTARNMHGATIHRYERLKASRRCGDACRIL